MINERKNESDLEHQALTSTFNKSLKAVYVGTAIELGGMSFDSYPIMSAGLTLSLMAGVIAVWRYYQHLQRVC